MDKRIGQCTTCEYGLVFISKSPCRECSVFSNYEPEEATPFEVSPVTKFTFTKGISGKEEE